MDAAQTNNTAPAANNKICDQCGRGFARSEHLDRHLLTHTQNRPYECQHCGQRFQRSDVLRRHQSKYCPNLASAQGSSGSDKKRSRVRVACLSCRDKKLRCDGKHPCSTCETKGYECLYQGQNTDQPTRPGDESKAQSRTQPQPSPNSSGRHSDVGPWDLTTFARGAGDTQAPLSSDAGLGLVPGVKDINYNASKQYEAQIFQNNPGPTLNTADPHATGPTADWKFGWNGDSAMHDFNFFDWMPTTIAPGIPRTAGIMNFSLENFLPGDELLPRTAFSEPNDASGMALENLRAQLGSHYETVRKQCPPIDEWLKQPIIPRKYDLELINMFLNLFKENVCPTFKSFCDFKITEETLPQQVLAMAAVGALFSSVDASFNVAQTLFGDASRMIVTQAHSELDIPVKHGPSLARAHLALEIFGFCSGHKRSNELSEAFHAHTLQTFTDYSIIGKFGHVAGYSQAQQQRLIGDLLILETYRMAVAQLYPTLRPELVQSYLDTFHKSEPRSPPSPTSRSYDAPCGQDTSIYEVAANSILSWFTMGMWTESSKPHHGTLWRREVPEMALKGLKGKLDTADNKPGLMLYHMNILALHAPMEIINNYTYSYAHGAQISADVIATLRQWEKDEDCDIACWHASQVKEQSRRGQKEATIESPHDALCIFLATMVLFVAAMASPSSNRATARLVLKEGMEIIRLYKVRVKTFLYMIMGSLFQNTEDPQGLPGRIPQGVDTTIM